MRTYRLYSFTWFFRYYKINESYIRQPTYSLTQSDPSLAHLIVQEI